MHESSKHFEKHILIASPDRNAFDYLSEHTSLSKTKLKSVMAKGAVWLESSTGIHRLRRGKKILKKDDVIHLYYDEAIQQSVPAAAILIADEKDYSIWNKPYGMYSQGTKWGDHFTIYRWAEKYLQPQRPAFLVHRLDRAANGLIILAHTKKIAAKFSEMFQQREITKIYKALVDGRPELTLPFTIDDALDGKAALSKITGLEQDPNDANRMVVTIEIDTGRKHQIRRHLAGLGYPIVGDRLYGSSNTDEDLQLQSNYLKFACPLLNTEREYRLD